jgi:hypothetical protein
MRDPLSMRLGDPLDPAIEAASLALNGNRAGATQGFASIELRGEKRQNGHYAPLGYAASALFGLIAVTILWLL